MASINKAILLGAVGRDPEVRDGNGMTMASLSIATNSRRKDKNGEWVEETEWHRISAFGKTAEFVKNYIKKGSQILVEGRLRTRKYTDKQGVERWQTEVLADNVQSIFRAQGDSQGQAQQSRPVQQSRPAQPQRQNDYYSDDVPF